MVGVAAIAVLALACAGVANAATLDLSRVTRGGGDSAVSASGSQDAENKAEHEGSGSTDQDARSTDQSSREDSISNNQSNDGDSGDNSNTADAAGDRDCEADFSTQEEAQRFFENHGGSEDNNVDGLDADGDGLACEDLPSESAPVGGIDTGAGGTAPAAGAGSSGPLPFVLAGAGLGLLLVLLGSSLRRRPGS